MSGVWLKLLVLALVFASVLLIVETLIRGMSQSRTQGHAINKRLQMIGRGVSREETMNRLRRRNLNVTTHLPFGLGRLAASLDKSLVAAGLTMPTGQVLLLLGAGPLVLLSLIIITMLVIGSPIGPGRLLMVGTFALVVGAALPLFFLHAKANRRRKKMQDQFPIALDVFVRGLRAGHPVASALDLLTVEMPDPIGSQFGIVVDEVTYGADLKDALQAMADRWDMEDIRMFVVSLSVQSETGGNLAEILENLSKVIRDRASMMMKVRALSSEGRMSAIMLTVLPVFTFAIVFLLNPAFYLEVADDPAFVPGFVGLLVVYIIGSYSIRKMVDLKV